jgi:hypothetical protein
VVRGAVVYREADTDPEIAALHGLLVEQRG